jgi:hypothetical protein
MRASQLWVHSVAQTYHVGIYSYPVPSTGRRQFYDFASVSNLLISLAAFVDGYLNIVFSSKQTTTSTRKGFWVFDKVGKILFIRPERNRI